MYAGKLSLTIRCVALDSKVSNQLTKWLLLQDKEDSIHEFEVLVEVVELYSRISFFLGL